MAVFAEQVRPVRREENNASTVRRHAEGERPA